MIYAVRTQRNMRFHVIVAVLVLVASLLVGVRKLELAVLVLTILLVFVTELFNTAMEFVVDLAVTDGNPMDQGLLGVRDCVANGQWPEQPPLQRPGVVVAGRLLDEAAEHAVARVAVTEQVVGLVQLADVLEGRHIAPHGIGVATTVQEVVAFDAGGV
jgi:lysylphosphatidylglycerol synthetase-like protein (DUF2156 family)